MSGLDRGAFSRAIAGAATIDPGSVNDLRIADCACTPQNHFKNLGCVPVPEKR
jgi:hypothetical protein